MNLHEYQAKEVFRSYGIPVPAGKVAASADEAVEAARALGGAVWVVKSQVHAGGRGKAGGVKLCRTYQEVAAAAKGMLLSPMGRGSSKLSRPLMSSTRTSRSSDGSRSGA